MCVCLSVCYGLFGYKQPSSSLTIDKHVDELANSKPCIKYKDFSPKIRGRLVWRNFFSFSCTRDSFQGEFWAILTWSNKIVLHTTLSKRPGIAGAVLQTPLSLIHYGKPKKKSRTRETPTLSTDSTHTRFEGSTRDHRSAPKSGLDPRKNSDSVHSGTNPRFQCSTRDHRSTPKSGLGTRENADSVQAKVGTRSTLRLGLDPCENDDSVHSGTHPRF